MTNPTSPADVYNEIADAFRDKRGRLPAYHIINHTMGNLIGDVKGFDVIDLATGDGQWARYAMEHGAASVLGVDVSREMIRLARESEAQNPIGCRYTEADIKAFSTEMPYDLATAGFLLNYARSREELQAMCDAIRALLKPGARFVGINSNMFLNSYGFDDWSGIGRRMTGPTEPEEGDALTIYLSNDEGPDVVFDNYYLAPETYASVFAEAGFSSFNWVHPTVSDEGRAEYGDAFWTPLLQSPQLIGFEAINGR